jgi:RNA polymerase sigma-70 factor (ECF subfamily)
VGAELAVVVAENLGRGDVDSAATAAVRALGAQMLSYLRSVLRDGDDSDDAFSLWAESVWSGLAEFRGESRLETWCYRIAWHAALRILRDPYRRRREALPPSRASVLAAEIRSTTAPHLAAGAAEGIARLRRQLTPEEQTLLVLRVDRDLPWRDIAEILSSDGETVNESALRKRYERIKERIAELAKGEGLL